MRCLSLCLVVRIDREALAIVALHEPQRGAGSRGALGEFGAPSVHVVEKFISGFQHGVKELGFMETFEVLALDVPSCVELEDAPRQLSGRVLKLSRGEAIVRVSSDRSLIGHRRAA